MTWIAAVLVAFGCPACIDINGGAVELSWALRDFDGSTVDGGCGAVRVDRIAICWQAVGDAAGGLDAPCDPGRRALFSCDDNNGVTGFDIDPGSTAFWMEPFCDDGDPADIGTYEVPPPIVRLVEEGRIVQLNSLLLVVAPIDHACPSSGCTCAR